MTSLVDSARSGSMETSAGDGFNSDSLSAVLRYSPARTVATVVAALPTPPQPPSPPPLPASSILNCQPFFDPISYLDSTTRSWPPRPLSASASGTNFPSLTNPPAAVNSLDDQAATAGSAPRSSKKRTRSTLRTPTTTVLTTDTSNFRAMVQQFTGMPSSPFDVVSAATSSSSLFGGSRFDLFRSSAGAAFGSSSFFEPPPFLRRPFPQLRLVRVSPSPTRTPTINCRRPSANNIQIPSHDLGFGSGQSQASPMLTLQSLLRAKRTTPPEMPAAASCSTKAQISTPAPVIELQPEVVPDGGKGDGRYSGRQRLTLS